jgi:hypothetical protein
MRFYFSEPIKGNYILLEINEEGEVIFKSNDELVITNWSPNLAMDSYFYKSPEEGNDISNIKVGEVTLSNVSYIRILFLNNKEKIVNEISIESFIKLVSDSIANQIVSGIEKENGKQ